MREGMMLPWRDILGKQGTTHYHFIKNQLSQSQGHFT